ncbi:hypothetical protein D8X55_00875 [Malacoplasma penetrans]|uniref:D-ribulose-5-phosphate 3 epimerase n=1 Tax=Malacoplasma penetrans (strain HF-2) TaxID=272633 RepID=Q8EVW3_MALP2|nr:d-ribulose-5-phosphate 3 epimerase [Malacoplasma penetrans]RXY97238.1 hypothetical protein D8X55_00875 [Malacoplasma penetrans]BAC44236.1 d-ribulose-5-phosphate 3 epimerase [Malacoplasma penetrans HF-2]
MVDITPSLKAIKDFNYFEWIKKIEKTGINSIHLDFMDCTRTKDFGLSFEILKYIDPSIRKDLHIMVDDAYRLIDFIPKVENVYIHTHYDMVKDWEKFIEKTNKLNFKTGITIDLNFRHFEKLKSFISKIDLINFMAVETIGNTGEKFDNKVLLNVKKIIDEFPLKKDVILQVDGSVREQHLADCKKYFNSIVVGSILFEFDDLEKRLFELQK